MNAENCVHFEVTLKNERRKLRTLTNYRLVYGREDNMTIFIYSAKLSINKTQARHGRKVTQSSSTRKAILKSLRRIEA